MKTIAIWLAASTLELSSLGVCYAQGSLLCSQTFSLSEGDPHIFNQANFWLDYENTNPPAGYFEPLFKQMFFATNDVGHTFTIASIADDTNFDDVANSLTNGIDQEIVFFLGNDTYGGAATGAWESQLCAGVGRGPDLIGYQVQAFDLHIDNLSFQTPGTNPNGDGNWTDFSGQVTLSIYGSPVPEPSAAAVMSLGSGVLTCLRRRSRRRRGLP